jgi:hypothetical protein
MADGAAGVTRTDAESLDTKSPRHEWERGWKVVAVSLLAYVFERRRRSRATGSITRTP